MGTTTNYLSYKWPVQRQSERVALTTRIRVVSGSEEYRGWCVDISESGIGFNVSADIPRASVVKLNVDMPNGEQLDELNAMVCWSNGFRYGCQFTNTSVEQRQQIKGLCCDPQGCVRLPKCKMR